MSFLVGCHSAINFVVESIEEANDFATVHAAQKSDSHANDKERHED
jgi:hypothetical protein